MNKELKEMKILLEDRLMKEINERINIMSMLISKYNEMLNETDDDSRKMIFASIVFDESFDFADYSTRHKKYLISDMNHLIKKLDDFKGFPLETKNFNIKKRLLEIITGFREDVVNSVNSGELLKEILHSTFENKKLSKIMNDDNEV